MKINTIILKLFPTSSKRQVFLIRVLKEFGIPIGQPDLNYHHWFEQFEKTKIVNNNKLKYQPLISVVAPCFNTPKYEFMEMIYSVINQSYENWELIIVNVSNKSKKYSYINRAVDIDERIKVISADNVDIPTNTNLGIKHAKGEYIGFLDHDDTLTFFALYEMAKSINLDQNTGLVYSDEDKVDANKRIYSDPFFKPDFSPELLENVNYITHFTVIKKSLIEKVGYMDPRCNGSQDYDLFLKIVDLGVKIYHVPLILYHWRKTKNSTANNINNKKYIFLSGKRALEQHVSRLCLRGRIKILENFPGFYKTVYENNKNISIVFLRQGSVVQQKLYIIEWLKINGSNKRIEQVLVSSKLGLSKEIDSKIISFNSDIELISILNKSKGVSVFFDGFYENKLHDNDWLDELVSSLQKKDVFSVSPVITNKYNIIKGAGYSHSSRQSNLRDILSGVKLGVDTPLGYSGFVRNVAAPNTSFFAINNSNIGKSIESLLDPAAHSKIALKNKMRSIIWTHIQAVDIGHDLDISAEYPALEFGKSTYTLSHLPEIEEIVNG